MSNRGFLWLIVLFASAAALAVLGQREAGQVIILYAPYRLEFAQFIDRDPDCSGHRALCADSPAQQSVENAGPSGGLSGARPRCQSARRFASGMGISERRTFCAR